GRASALHREVPSTVSWASQENAPPCFEVPSHLAAQTDNVRVDLRWCQLVFLSQEQKHLLFTRTFDNGSSEHDVTWTHRSSQIETIADRPEQLRMVSEHGG